MLLVHGSSQMIMSSKQKSQNQGAKCYGSAKSGDRDAGMCGWGRRIKQMLDLPGLGILVILSPREGTHPQNWKIL